MARQHDFDLFVIGGGSAGVRLARTAASLGARVAVAERKKLGGTCVNVGCVPKKLFVYAAHVAHEMADAAGFGWSIAKPAFDWRKLRTAEEAEVSRLNGIYRRLLEQAGVEILEADAALRGPNEVDVAGRTARADHIAIASGAAAKRPAIPGAELGIVSDDCFVLERLPASIAIVGSGYIAVEFAGIFAGLGVETTVIARGERLLPHFDRDVGLALARELGHKGVRVILQRPVERVEKRGDRVALVGAALEQLADAVLFAIGRRAALDCLSPELGVRTKPDGAVAVDDELRTSVPSIRALGDVIGHLQLTPVALAEATALAKTLFAGRGPVHVDYHDVPTAVFTMPEVGTVGLTEAQAVARFASVAVYETEFRPLKHTVSGSSERTYMKLVVDAPTDRVAGVHVVGADAAELVQGLAVALKANATKAAFDATIGIHPTSAEEIVTLRAPTRIVPGASAP
jgi:glutathione reductase (NADPH)